MSDTGLLWMLLLSGWGLLFVITFKMVRMEDKLRSDIIKERIAREKALWKIQKEIHTLTLCEVMNGKYEPTN